MLSAAFKAMAVGVRNHAAEFVGDGRLVKAKITPELRTAIEGTPELAPSLGFGDSSMLVGAWALLHGA